MWFITARKSTWLGLTSQILAEKNTLIFFHLSDIHWPVIYYVDVMLLVMGYIGGNLYPLCLCDLNTEPYL